MQRDPQFVHADSSLEAMVHLDGPFISLDWTTKWTILCTEPEMGRERQLIDHRASNDFTSA
jgi:hypothetical protein